MTVHKKVLSQIEAKEIYNDKLILMHVKNYDIFNCKGKAYIFGLDESDRFFEHYKNMLNQYPESIFVFYGENVGVSNGRWVDVSEFKDNDGEKSNRD